MCSVQCDCWPRRVQGNIHGYWRTEFTSREVLASGIVLCRLLFDLLDFHGGCTLYVVGLVFGVVFSGVTSCFDSFCVSVLIKF